MIEPLHLADAGEILDKLNDVIAELNRVSALVDDMNGRIFVPAGCTMTLDSGGSVVSTENEPTTHTWADAFAHMKKGGKVRRESWEPTIELAQNRLVASSQVIVYTHTRDNFPFSAEDLGATDWVLLPLESKEASEVIEFEATVNHDSIHHWINMPLETVDLVGKQVRVKLEVL